jgi:hypothetical protein
VAARDVSDAMRREFDDNAVIPRPILAARGRSAVVNSKNACSRRGKFLIAGVVAIA